MNLRPKDGATKVEPVGDKPIKSGIAGVPDNDGKADQGKTRMSLLMSQFGKSIKGAADVLTFGAMKYPKPPLDNSWRDVPNAEQRYTDALYRHLLAALSEGEKLDEESGLDHLDHALVNIMFLRELRSEPKKRKRRASK